MLLARGFFMGGLGLPEVSPGPGGTPGSVPPWLCLNCDSVTGMPPMNSDLKQCRKLFQMCDLDM